MSPIHLGEERIQMRRKRIAVLMASIDREYQQEFAAALVSAGQKNDTDICIFNSQGHMNVAISTSETGESMIYDLPDLEAFDGIISMPATMGSDMALQKIYEILSPLKGIKPHISIDVPQEGAVTIRFDDRSSMDKLTEHLIDTHSVRNIVFVSGPTDSSVSTERMEACRRVMERHGINTENCTVYDGQWTRAGGRKAAEKILLRPGGLPEAVICANDDMALSLIDCLVEHEIRVPEDVAVTGFDALREAVMRGLTTIRRPVDVSAMKAVEILGRWIDGTEPEQKELVLPTLLYLGDSCGCSRSTEHIQEKLRALGSERWDMETILARASMFSGTMAGVGDEREAREIISEFVDSWKIREFYLCVNPSICRETGNEEPGKGYPSGMLMLYGSKDGRQYSSGMIPVSGLVPAMEEERTEAVCLVFCPLYYRDRSLGYVAMSPGSGTGSALYPVLMLLNGALMSLYLQTSIKRSAAVIERMATEDIMTGLLNRRGYMEQAPKVLEQAKAQGRIFALLSADMDHMKDINDRYGHLAGDEAICRMGRALRALDKHGITPVHISGDEFIAYGIVENPAEAAQLVNCVNSEIEQINRQDPWICEISASFGVFAAYPRPEDDLDYFMTMADRLMYADKNKRKYHRRKDDIRPEA